MGTLIERLAAEEILPAKTVLDLREYISKKHPSLSLVRKAAVFADAVNRILNDSMPGLSEDSLNKFKVILFRAAAGKTVFCINGSDIFKSSLRLRLTDDPFMGAMGDWLEKTLEMPVDRDKVSSLVTIAYAMMDESPDMELDRLIRLAEESAGEIRLTEKKASEIDLAEESAGEIRLTEKKAGEMDLAEESTDEAGFANEAIGGVVLGGGKIAAVEQKGPESTVIPFVPADSDKESLAVRTLFAKYIPAKSKAIKAIAAVGLIAVSVALSYFSALYINATENTGLSNDGIAVIEQEELPGGAVVPADPRDEGSGELKMTATAYDLSFESCGKDRSHPAYGVTSSGTKATAGRTIAVDPEVIPLGSRVKITFPEKYSYLDGIYIAEDTGRLIKGNRVDVFFGEDETGSKTVNRLAMDFGVQDVEVEVLE